eukprot:gb/GFBE01068295.1/.p1 GENE.gb/GFBE01068295.1/~~gb/GFBE01068295.1/.p1  ORF type:complete len:377 (+),score=68.19 gb/GFBE01068295.1/:1-1131(+)
MASTSELPHLLGVAAPHCSTGAKEQLTQSSSASTIASALEEAAPVSATASTTHSATSCYELRPWDDLMASGQAFAALILSTHFSEKYQGRHMQPGDSAEVRLPGGAAGAWRPTLLYRAGCREAVAFTWLGDEAAGDRSIYVAFAPMRRKRQFLKIIGPGDALVPELLVPPGGSARESGAVVMMSPYIQKKLRKVWGSYGLFGQLSEALARFPQHRVVFAGISHGATLAQAAALQFQHYFPVQDRVHAVTWNAFKWTDALGSELVRGSLGTRLLPFLMARQGRWDSVAGFPSGLAPLQQLVLLDADSGALHSRETSASFPGTSNPMNPQDWRRALELHFAAGAIKAMKQAMVNALEGSCNLCATLRAPGGDFADEEA